MSTTENQAEYRTERIARADWERVRTIRLAMLADTPLAYLETHAQALAYDESEWRFRAVRANEPGRFGVVAVGPEGGWVGTMGAYLTEPGLAVLVGVWVHAEHRGRGLRVADTLLDEVLGWARTEGAAERIFLEVHESNSRAAAFYERRGFVRTGRTRPYGPDPDTVEIEMDLLL
ncbi:GNAT family N-acetyltransferase [Kitasatospora sp. McL0602]|uniref:GNAT family N-acetyltransferase n=1 Tax=Kitasatospora sp. McL0602 TaxID=3439530 RepID=UPI003F8AEC7E